MLAEGIAYEAENTALYGASSFYVTPITENWAVSNVGSFENGSFVQNTSAQVIASNTPELYQTSRMSPGSLRYYGLGLVNGLYNVSLFFAETGFDDQSSRTWKSWGRRVFDIYIQVTIALEKNIFHSWINIITSSCRVSIIQITFNFKEFHFNSFIRIIKLSYNLFSRVV